MFSGLKFIPRDHIDEEEDGKSYSSRKKARKSGRPKEKLGKKSKHSCYSSSDDEGLERIKSGSRKKKKWYDPNEDLSSFSDESDSQSEEHDQKRHKSRKEEKKKHDHSSDNGRRSRSKKKDKSRRGDYSSEYKSSDGSESERSGEERGDRRGEMNKSENKKEWGIKSDKMENNLTTGSKGSQSQSSDILREEIGLGWMLRPKNNSDETSNKSSLIEPEEASVEEVKKNNPRELNPYLKDNGVGYPEESDGVNAGLSTTVVGDGGASWRLKALKRSKEQAAREGRNLQQVVEERWGSMGQFAASMASRDVASTHAHLQAINHRRKGLMKEEKQNLDEENNSIEKIGRKDITPRHSKMKVPKVHDSLSWGKRGRNKLSAEDSALVSAAMSNLNKFSNDGNFMAAFTSKEEKHVDQSNSSNSEARAESTSTDFAFRENKEDVGTSGPPMSANQLAAKALQLRMKGRHDEAEKLLKEADNIKGKQDAGNESSRPKIDGTTSRFIMHDVSARQKRKEDDGDLHLAQRIAQNQRYNISNQADEEYDYDDGPRKKTRKKGGDSSRKSSEITNSANRILTQQERCQFCFENPARPKHLVISIANFTYLSIPHQQPVVPGHCCILTLQHESSTRTVDDNVWDEIRNFKKCLIMMFAKQEKDVVFFETVMGLSRQRRHCLVECVPMPRDIAKQAPLYFKKAIDEAEDEWSQHNAKKLIDTSEKGLRGSIPKNFPYFHVEFGLKRGFVHVIDDEKEFQGSFGLNVVRGMLKLPAEDMHRRRRNESVEAQMQAVASFAKDWQPFDWTKQLD